MSRRAVAALALLAAALGMVLLLEPPAGRVVAGDQRLFPTLTAGSVARLALLRAGRAPLVVTRGDGGSRVDGAPADEAAVRELVDTLASLVARRRLPTTHEAARGLDPPRLVVELTDGSVTRRLAIGDVEPALGRAWARRLDVASRDDLQIDGHAARLLDRDPAELRRRAPFVEPLEPRRLALSAGGERLVSLEGAPLCVAHPPGCALADPRRVAALLASLADLRVSRFLPADPPGAPELRVDVDGAWLEVRGACPGAETDRAVSSSLGTACVPAAQLGPLLAAPRDPLGWVERRVTTLAPAEIDAVSGSGVALARRGASWRQGTVELSSDAVRDWLDALLSYEGAPRWIELTGGSVSAGLELAVGAGGREERAALVDAPGGPEVRRAGEPLALRMHPSIRTVWRLDPVSLADRRVSDVDPVTVASIRIADAGAPEEIVERGATLERWRLTAPLALDADVDTVAALRDAAARMTARSVLAAAPLPRHGLAPPRRRITLVLDAAPGADAGGRVVVDLGAADETGCRARRGDGGPVFLLAPASCASLDAHLATRELLPSDLDEITAVTTPRGRLERHGDRWYREDGTALDAREAARLEALLRALARAPAVDSYGAPEGVALLAVETARGRVELVRSGALYGRRDRAVRYELSADALRLLP